MTRLLTLLFTTLLLYGCGSSTVDWSDSRQVVKEQKSFSKRPLKKIFARTPPHVRFQIASKEEWYYKLESENPNFRDRSLEHWFRRYGPSNTQWLMDADLLSQDTLRNRFEAETKHTTLSSLIDAYSIEGVRVLIDMDFLARGQLDGLWREDVENMRQVRFNEAWKLMQRRFGEEQEKLLLVDEGLVRSGQQLWRDLDFDEKFPSETSRRSLPEMRDLLLPVPDIFASAAISQLDPVYRVLNELQRTEHDYSEAVATEEREFRKQTDRLRGDERKDLADLRKDHDEEMRIWRERQGDDWEARRRLEDRFSREERRIKGYYQKQIQRLEDDYKRVTRDMERRYDDELRYLEREWARNTGR